MRDNPLKHLTWYLGKKGGTLRRRVPLFKADSKKLGIDWGTAWLSSIANWMVLRPLSVPK